MNKHIQPLVSVVIACYNHDKFVQDSIQSVINQTYQNIELMIIDDGSSDGSVEKIKLMIAVCEQRFTRFEFKTRPNKGLCLTLNEALDWCQGKYFSGVASDDVMLKEKITTQVQYLEDNQQCVAVFGGIELIDSDGNRVSKRINKFRVYDFVDLFMHDHELPAPTQLIVLQKIKDVGMFKSGFILEDWYMWLKLAQLGELHYLSECFALYRQHDNNISKKVDIMHEGRFQVINEYMDNELYPRAKKEIEWVTLREMKSNKHPKFFVDFFSFVILNPIFSFNKILLMIFGNPKY